MCFVVQTTSFGGGEVTAMGRRAETLAVGPTPQVSPGLAWGGVVAVGLALPWTLGILALSVG